MPCRSGVSRELLHPDIARPEGKARGLRRSYIALVAASQSFYFRAIFMRNEIGAVDLKSTGTEVSVTKIKPPSGPRSEALIA